jgi:uncharacterized membrane protein
VFAIRVLSKDDKVRLVFDTLPNWAKGAVWFAIACVVWGLSRAVNERPYLVAVGEIFASQIIFAIGAVIAVAIYLLCNEIYESLRYKHKILGIALSVAAAVVLLLVSQDELRSLHSFGERI